MQEFSNHIAQILVLDTNTEKLTGSISSHKQNILVATIKNFPQRLDWYKKYCLQVILENRQVLTILNARIKREAGGLYKPIYDYEFESTETLLGHEPFELDKGISSFAFICEYLGQWLHKGGSQISSAAKESTVIGIPNLETQNLFNASDYSIWLNYKPEIVSIHYPFSGAEVKDKWFIEIRSRICNLTQMREVSRKIMRLISFATQSPIMFRETQIIQDRNSFEGRFFSMYDVEPEEEYLGLQALFLFPEIEFKISNVIAFWLELYEICGAAIDNYIAITHNENLYWENAFLMQVQTLEGLHRAILKTKKYPDEQFKEIKAQIIQSCPQEHKIWLENLISNEPSLGMRIREIWDKYAIGSKPWYESEFKNLNPKMIKTYRNLLTHSESERPNIRDVAPYIRMLNKVNQELILHYLGVKRRHEMS